MGGALGRSRGRADGFLPVRNGRRRTAAECGTPTDTLEDLQARVAALTTDVARLAADARAAGYDVDDSSVWPAAARLG